MELAKTSLEIKRKEIQNGWIEDYSLLQNDIWEACETTFLRLELTDSTKRLSILPMENTTLPMNGDKILRKKCFFYARKTDGISKHNGKYVQPRTTPAEGTTYRFAKEDKNDFPKFYNREPKKRHIIRILHNFPWNILTTLLRHCFCRIVFKHSTPEEPCFISTWANALPMPMPVAIW